MLDQEKEPTPKRLREAIKYILPIESKIVAPKKPVFAFSVFNWVT